MLNAARDTVVSPPVTLIRMLAKVPALAVVGIPERAPVLVLKVAHAGMLTIEKLKLSPLGAVTTGVKLYVWPAVMLAGGVPLMVGGAGGGAGSGVVDVAAAMTVMRNGPTV